MPPKKDLGAALANITGKNSGISKATINFAAPNIREELEKETQNTPDSEIEIEALFDNPYQQYARYEAYDEAELENLVSSIRENGFFGALLARPMKAAKGQEASKYELAYGHRRKEAARRAGLTKLPVKLIDLADRQMLQIMASENFARQDLTPMGEANVVGLLYDEENLTAAEVAAVIGKGLDWVKLRLKLHHASADIRNLVEAKPDTLGHIRLLEAVTDAKYRSELIEEIKAGTLDRAKLTARVEAWKNPAPQPEPQQAELVNSVITAPQSLEQPSTPPIVTNFTEKAPYPNSEISNNKVEANANIEARQDMSISHFDLSSLAIQLARLADRLVNSEGSLSDEAEQELRRATALLSDYLES